MKNRKILLSIIMISLLLGLILTVVENTAHQNGLELRTFAQEIKGLYLWIIMPYTILFAGNAIVKPLFRERTFTETDDTRTDGTEPHTFLHLLRGIVLVFFFMVILAAGFFRSVFYVFSREMVTERILPDGYIEGTWSDFLTESHTDYYVPTAILFRKSFSGWTEEQLTKKVREKYSADAELVEQQENGRYVFRMPDALAENSYIYFHVSDSYNMSSNGFFQILLSEASHFWSNRSRTVTINADKNSIFEDVMDFGEPTADPYLSGLLHITCSGTQEDIAACAADLTDWLLFVKNTGQLPYDSDYDAYYLLSVMLIGSKDDYFHFDLSPFQKQMDNASWDTLYQQIKSKLDTAFSDHTVFLERWEQTHEGQETAADYGYASENELYSHFMDTYDGHYEKECLIGDGTIRYRMVVEDAALGSRFYGLLKSTDAGETWQMSNPDPFDQQMGMGIDFTFLDEHLGFATLMHNGGDEADLYITEDGGNTYQLVIMQGYTVSLEDGYTYNPYDYPQMPYADNGAIYVLCGQGTDGDYAGGDAAGLALYQSTDGGHTFTFVEIQSPHKRNW